MICIFNWNFLKFFPSSQREENLPLQPFLPKTNCFALISTIIIAYTKNMYVCVLYYQQISVSMPETEALVKDFFEIIVPLYMNDPYNPTSSPL